ncbi:MAG: hypothetical protein ACSHYB_08335 [Roseibacillus sp.]
MKRILTGSALTLLFAAGAAAEPEKDKKKGRDKGFRGSEFAAQFFSRLDTNEDGAVSQEEFAANPRLERATPEQQVILFERLDKDGDGSIKPEELKPPKGMRPGEKPGWLQKGPVNFEQFSQQPRVQRLNEEMRRKLFDRLDQNSDGILSEADIPRGKGPRPERRPQGPPPHADLDSDEDGKISFSEFQNAPFHKGVSEDEVEDRFEAMDQDSDGFISSEERQKGHLRKEDRQDKPKRKRDEPKLRD